MPVNQSPAESPSDVAATEAASRADSAYRQILLRIIRGELPALAELKTTRLARELGLSRTPVRQALAELAADGIIEHKPNQRAVVRPGAEHWLLQIHELRMLLEPPAAARAARQMPSTALAQLETLANAAAPHASPEWIAAAQRFDYALHLTIAEHAGNLPLCETIRKCWSYKRLSYEAGTDAPAALERGYREHQAILVALAAGEPDAAAAAMLHHLHSAALARPAARIV